MKFVSMKKAIMLPSDKKTTIPVRTLQFNDATISPRTV
jgi:hypothetical protein